MAAKKDKKRSRPKSIGDLITRPGRKSKLSEDIQNTIVTAIRAGNYVETAAEFAGISKTTFYEWKRRGEAREQQIEALEIEASLKGAEAEIPDDLEGDMYLQFMDAIRRASAESEVADITTIGIAASRDWRAAAWRLERKFPTRYGRQSIEFSGPNGGAIPVAYSFDLTKCTDEELKVLEKIALKAGASDETTGEPARTG